MSEPNHHLDPRFLQALDEFALTQSLDIKQLYPRQKILASTIYGSSYLFEVTKSATPHKSPEIILTSPEISDIFGKDTVPATIRGSTLGKSINTQSLAQDYALEIGVPFSELPLLKAPEDIPTNHYAHFYLLSLPEINNLYDVTDQRDAWEIRATTKPVISPESIETIKYYIFSPEQILEHAHELGITREDIYKTYVSLQTRYAIGLENQGRLRRFYKYGRLLRITPTVLHSIYEYQQEFLNHVAEGNIESQQFCVQRMAAIDMWATELDKRFP